MSPPDQQESPLSIAELRFYLTRAAVGCGVPFGVAEDFAEAVVTSARMGLDPAPIALHALTSLDEKKSDWGVSVSRAGDGLIFRPSGRVQYSAVYGGCSVVDHLYLMTDSATVEIMDVDEPLLLACYLKSPLLDARHLLASWKTVGGEPIIVEFEGGRVTTVYCKDEGTLLMTGPVDVRITAASHADQPDGAPLIDRDTLERAYALPLEAGVTVDGSIWAQIYELFRRYLVPSSEEERATAAGAGLVDRD